MAVVKPLPAVRSPRQLHEWTSGVPLCAEREMPAASPVQW